MKRQRKRKEREIFLKKALEQKEKEIESKRKSKSVLLHQRCSEIYTQYEREEGGFHIIHDQS